VAETLPLAEHRGQRRGSARCRRWPAGDECLPPAGAWATWRLLQHHLADKDCPRLGSPPPRQLVPPMHPIPAREPTGPHRAQFVRLRAPRTLRRPSAMAQHTITLIPGDGVGPEVSEAARRVIDATGVAIDWEVHDAGLGVMEQYGDPLPAH